MDVKSLFQRYNMKKGLTESECKDIIEQLGIPVQSRIIARDAHGAVAAGRAIGFPVVMKVVCRDILHKSDAGCVKLNLASAHEIEKAYDRILANARNYNAAALIEGVLVERMAKDGTEMMVGFKRDATFGPTVLVGLGGIYVEIFKDVSLRVLPIDIEEADEMISELKCFPILKGARGKSPADIEALERIVLRAGSIMEEVPEVEAIDFNPVVVFEKGKGAAVVDARIILRGGNRDAQR